MSKMSKWFYIIVGIAVVVVIISALNTDILSIYADVDVTLRPDNNALFKEGTTVSSYVKVTSTAGDIDTVTLDIFSKVAEENVWVELWSNDVSAQNIDTYESTDTIGELGNGSYSIRLTVLIKDHPDEPITTGRTFYVGTKPFGIADIVSSFEWLIVIFSIPLLIKLRRKNNE